MQGGNGKPTHLLNVLFCNQNRQYKPVDITKIHINNFINFTKKNTREHGGWAPDDIGWRPTRKLFLGGSSPVAEGIVNWVCVATLKGKPLHK